MIIIIIKDVPDHFSVLIAVDDSLFLSESECYSILLYITVLQFSVISL